MFCVGVQFAVEASLFVMFVVVLLIAVVMLRAVLTKDDVVEMIVVFVLFDISDVEVTADCVMFESCSIAEFSELDRTLFVFDVRYENVFLMFFAELLNVSVIEFSVCVVFFAVASESCFALFAVVEVSEDSRVGMSVFNVLVVMFIAVIVSKADCFTAAIGCTTAVLPPAIKTDDHTRAVTTNIMLTSARVLFWNIEGSFLGVGGLFCLY